MFAERGFAAISIRDVAGASKISIPSIYHFYGNKERLYASCCDEIFRSVATRVHAKLVAEGSAKDRIRGFTVTLAEILLEDRVFRLLLQRELLREERRAIDELTTHHFRTEFGMLGAEIAKLTRGKNRMEQTFCLYALTFGLIQLRRISEVAGVNKALVRNPARLAEHVLSIVLPSFEWGD